MWQRLLNAKTGLIAAGVAAGTPHLGSDAEEWATWLELIIRILAVVAAFLAGRKTGEEKK